VVLVSNEGREEKEVTRPGGKEVKVTTRDFKVFLEPDAGYGGYMVVCPSLPSCYSQGKTVSGALANIREAIDLCLENMES
jgi:predicted RNase H-like HicB family nuclease